MASGAIENVQDYPRPPALERVAEALRIVLGGETIAETTRGFRVLETHHAPTYYFPPEDVFAQMSPASGRSFCEWKGAASYWNVTQGEVTAPRGAWSFARPTARFQPIADHLAFYASSMDACFVGDNHVIPQPGDFYGGWITENLRGRIKGAPGTEHW